MRKTDTGFIVACVVGVVEVALLWLLLYPSMHPQPALASDFVLLMPSGTRCCEPETPKVHHGSGAYVLAIPLVGNITDHPPAAYSVTIGREGRVIWTSDPSQPIESARDDQFFDVIVPGSFLEAGRYVAVMYAARGTAREKLAEYPFEVGR